VKSAVRAAVGAILVTGAISATVTVATAKPKPPLSTESASTAASYTDRAIKAEQEAINALDDHKILTASREAKLGTVYIGETFIALENHDVGDSGKTQNFAGAAHTLDQSVDSDLLKAQSANGKQQDALIKDATSKLERALVFKHQVEVFFLNYFPSEPAPPSAPEPGPLTVCVFITNNGSTSTENVHVRDPHAGGMTGTVTFNGQGVNQTNPITLDPNGSAITPFPVSVFGTATIGVMVGPQSASTTFTLGAGNDITTSDCP
jgi:hypothetical protein